MLFYNIHFILRTTEDLVRKTIFMISALEGKKLGLFLIQSDYIVTLLYICRFLREHCLRKAFLLDYLWRLVMGNAAAGGLEQETTENSVGTTTGMGDPAQFLQKKQPAPSKLPMPPEEELEERFNLVLVSNCENNCPVLNINLYSPCIISQKPLTTHHMVYYRFMKSILKNQHTHEFSDSSTFGIPYFLQ